MWNGILKIRQGVLQRRICVSALGLFDVRRLYTSGRY